MVRAEIIVAVLALTLPIIFGQAVSGVLTGYVTDPSKTPVPGAVVTATEKRTGVTTKRTTDASGLYIITNLVPGVYSISVEAPGFQKSVQENITLSVDSKVAIDVQLTIGTVTEAVTVSGAPPPLQTEKTDVAVVISAQQIEALPVVGRNVSELYNLVPGVVKNFFQIGKGENPSEFNNTMVNGQFFGNSEYQIDGVTDTAYGFSGFQIIVPNQESVQEMKITTADYDPEYGSSAGMVAQYVTKSGTNDVHGSVFWFNRNKFSFAADPFTEKIPGTGKDGKGFGPAPFNWNQGGLSLGGPIKKNKMFAFGDYQLARASQGASLTATVPNDAFRTGDFSAFTSSNPIFDPLTGNADGTGRQQFSCNGVVNVICPGRISPVAQKLLKLLPGPNLNQATDVNYAGGGTAGYNTDQFDIRYDWNISDQDKFFVRYTYLSSLLKNPPLFGAVAGGPAVGGLSPETAETRSQQVALNYTRTFSPSLLSEFRLGVVRFRLDGYQADAGLKTDDEVGIPGINLGDRLTGGLAGIGVGGPVGGWFMGIQSGVGIPRLDRTTGFQFINNWSQIRGDHQIRWGADIRRNRFDFLSVNASSRGNFNFCQSITASPAVNGSGLGMASFLLGMPCEFDRAIFTIFPGERQTRLAFYGQDVWKVTPKLSVNYGVRYDYFQPVKPRRKGGIVNWDPGTGDLLLAGLGDVSMSANVKSLKDNFSPRVGIAYQITQRTVIRTGFGRSYFGGNYDAVFYHLTSSYPIIAQQTINQSNTFQPIFVLNGSTGPPAAAPPVFPESGHIKPPPDTLLKPRPFNWKTEYVDSWNFTIEQRLAQDVRLAVAYVGNGGRDLDWGSNINAAPSGPGDLQSRRPYFQKFGENNPFAYLCNCMSSSYNALQVSVDKRFASGYSINSAFTWAKAMDHELGGFGWGDQSINPYDAKSSWGISTYNRAAVWTLSHLWEVPYGKGHKRGSNANGVVNAILGGWMFTGVTTVESGFPISPNSSRQDNLNGEFGQRPDVVAGVGLYDVPGGQSRNHWYNPAAFNTSFPCCRWGNAGRSSMRGPGMASADWAFWKEFKFRTPLNREETKLQFRWENYNLFNRTNMGMPDNTVDSSTAGRITQLAGAGSGFGIIGPMRRMQFGLRLAW